MFNSALSAISFILVALAFSTFAAALAIAFLKRTPFRQRLSLTFASFSLGVWVAFLMIGLALTADGLR